MSDPLRPTVIATVSEEQLGGEASDVCLVGDIAVVSIFSYGVRAFDVRDPHQPLEIAHLAIGRSIRRIEAASRSLYLADADFGVRRIRLVDLEPTPIP